MNIAKKKILSGYVGLIKSLSPNMKASLMDRLKESVERSRSEESVMEEAYGAWYSNESTKEIVDSIRSSRKVNRKIDSF